jgi:hypothetical protein
MGGYAASTKAPAESQSSKRAPARPDVGAQRHSAAIVPRPGSRRTSVGYAVAGVSSAGEPLPREAQKYFSALLGVDLSTVRIHSDLPADRAARRVGAVAYTIGERVAFRSGSYMPETLTGRTLLAHELAHVVQQRAGLAPSGAPEVQDNSLESGARTAAAGVARGERVAMAPSGPPRAGHISAAAVVQREPAPDADVLPDPVERTWGGDPFRIEFVHSKAEGTDRVEFVVTYLGPFPVDGPFVTNKSQRLGLEIGSQALKATVQPVPGNAVGIDLYGFGDTVAQLVDEAQVDDRPGKGRRHDFSAREFGETRSVISMWVKDPAAKPQAVAEKPTMQGDIPGERPESRVLSGGATQIRIDGDGDQSKELLLTFSPKAFWDPANTARVKVLGVTIQQISSGETREVSVDIPELIFGAVFWPLVQQTTDGKVPTYISLVAPIPIQWLQVYPPTRDDKGITYPLKASGLTTSITLPPEAPRVVTSAQEPVRIGGIDSVDLTLGAYNDHFRLTIQTSATSLTATGPNPAVVGLSPLFRGQALAGQGATFVVNRSGGIRIVESGISVTLDIDGDPQHQLHIYDHVEAPASYDGGGPPEKNRNHDIRVTQAGSAEQVFRFQVRYGYPLGTFSEADIDRQASSNARAVTSLKTEAKTATADARLDAYESQMMGVRKSAADEKLIGQDTYQAWRELSEAMITLRPEVLKKKEDPSVIPDPAMQVRAASAAGRLYLRLAAETKGREEAVPTMSEVSSTDINPYTGEMVTTAPFVHDVTPGPGSQVQSELLAAQWDAAYRDYNALVDGLDRWIVQKLKETHGETSEAFKQAQLLTGRKSAISSIADFKPIRVLAVFHPDKRFETEAGYIDEIPLELYVYRDNGDWHLRDFTNPDKPWDYTVSARPGDDTPPTRIWSELDDPDHFPVGVVHFEVPGRYGGQIRTTDYLTWKKFFTYLGLGLAAIGITLITLATFGTGTVAVVGAWALAASAVAGGVAAGIDLAEGIKHGQMTTTRFVIDIGQIVASIAGVSALRSGLIVREAMTAAEAGTPLAGAAAESAMLAQKVYFVSTVTRIGADVVTLAGFSVEVARQLDAIQEGAGTQSEKDRAKFLILAQLAVTGGLVALSIKGELPKLTGGRQLILRYPDPNGPPVASVGGMEVPTAIKFSQKDVGPVLGDKQTPFADLVDSLRKEGWKGEPIDVVELRDGSKVSLDNRRLLAAQMAGMKEIPVAYHPPNEPFPAARAASDAFELKVPIRRLPDEQLVIGGQDGEVAFAKGYHPKTYGEAAMVRTANQGNVKGGGRFPLWGTTDQPLVRGQKAPGGTPGGPGGGGTVPVTAGAGGTAPSTAGPSNIPVNGTINVGGGFEPASRNATNLQPFIGTSGPGAGADVPNLVQGRFEDMAKLFPAGSARNVVSIRLPFVTVEWPSAANATFQVLAPGGRFSLNVWTSSIDDVNTVIDAFTKAGFKDVKNATGLVGSGTLVEGVR